MKMNLRYLLRLELAPNNSFGQATSMIRTKLSEVKIVLLAGLVITKSATETTRCVSMTERIESRAELHPQVFLDRPLGTTKKGKN